MAHESDKEAILYEKLEGGKANMVRCALCAHRCKVAPGKRGRCGVRENRDGTLVSLVYGRLISANPDPIEKKPLFHYLPGSSSFSIATVGCNLRCLHCQNADISQWPHEHALEEPLPGRDTTAEDVVEAAINSGCRSIAYTYTEPTIAMEFYLEVMELAKSRRLGNVFVSNGFMTPESARTVAPLLDANNIDLKGDDEFYRHVCGARLGPVEETIGIMKEAGVWVEVTTLVIPGHNDSYEVLAGIAGFIASVDVHMPWHVTRFHPTYKLTDAPSTPIDTLARAMRIGKEAGLSYVYEGNVPGEEGQSTYCRSCGKLLIRRTGFMAERIVMGSNGKCPDCDTTQMGVWGNPLAPV